MNQFATMAVCQRCLFLLDGAPFPLFPFEAMDGDLQLPPNYFFSGIIADKFGKWEEEYQNVQSTLQKVSKKAYANASASVGIIPCQKKTRCSLVR